MRAFPVLVMCVVLALAQLSNGSGSAEPRSPKPVLVPQFASSETAWDAAFAARAPVLALNGGGGLIDIWDSSTWTLLRTVRAGAQEEGRSCNTKALALSPDGRTLACMTSAGEVRLWDVKTGEMTGALPEPVGLPVGVVWSTDGSRIAAGGASSVRVWNAKSRRLIRSFDASGDVGLSRDAKVLGAAGGGDAALFDIDTGQKLVEFSDEAGVQGPIAISPGGNLVATGGEDPDFSYDWPYDFALTESAFAHQLKVKVWDRQSGELVCMLPGHYSADGGTAVLQFMPDSRVLVSGGDGYCALWDTKTGKQIRYLESERACAMSPDGRMIFVTRGGLRVYSAANGKELARFHMPPARVQAVAFSPDGKTLAAGEQAFGMTGLRLWDVSTGKQVRVLAGPDAQIHDIAFLPGGRVAINAYQAVWIWSTASGKLLKKLRGPLEDTHGAEEFRYHTYGLLTPDGSLYLTESGGPFDKLFQVRDAKTNNVQHTIPAGMGWLVDSAFSPDGRWLAASVRSPHSIDGTVSVWDLHTGTKLSDIEGMPYGARPMVFSPDGSCIAGVADKSGISLWDTATGKKKRLIKTSGYAAALAFSPGADRLAAALPDGIAVFDIDSGHCAGVIDTRDTRVDAIAFSPGGTLIAGGDERGQLRIWEAKQGKLLVTMVGLTTPDRKRVSPDWYAFTPDGFCDWSDGAAELLKWRCDGKLYPASKFEKQMRRRGLLQ